MMTFDKTEKLNVLEILYGKQTTLVCQKTDMPSHGTLKITDLNGNIHYDQYFLTLPKQCFSSKDIMLLNIDDSTLTLDLKIEIE